MQNKKYPAQTWDTSNLTNRRKGKASPNTIISPGRRAQPSWDFQGQIKVGMNNWTLLRP